MMKRQPPIDRLTSMTSCVCQLACLAMVLSMSSPAFAQSAPASDQTAAPVATPEAATGSDVKRYCTSIAVAAGDARFAYQTSRLAEIETRIKAKLQELDAKSTEVRGWIERRDAIEKKAAEKLVGIYSKMRPETAATQIVVLDDDMAAAILGQLTPRQASAIFNELVPERAGKLAAMIAGTTPSTDKKL